MTLSIQRDPGSNHAKIGITYGPVECFIKEDIQHLRHFQSQLEFTISEYEEENS